MIRKMSNKAMGPQRNWEDLEEKWEYWDTKFGTKSKEKRTLRLTYRVHRPIVRNL